MRHEALAALVALAVGEIDIVMLQQLWVALSMLLLLDGTHWQSATKLADIDKCR